VAKGRTWINRVDPEYRSHNGQWLRAKRSVFGSQLGGVTPIFSKTTNLFRPIQRLVKLKLPPLSHAARQLKNTVKNSFLSSSGFYISGVGLSRPVLLHAVVFRI